MEKPDFTPRILTKFHTIRVGACAVQKFFMILFLFTLYGVKVTLYDVTLKVTVTVKVTVKGTVTVKVTVKGTVTVKVTLYFKATLYIS